MRTMPSDSVAGAERRGTVGLWSEFLRRLMVTVTLAAPAAVDAAAELPPDSTEPAEIGQAPAEALPAAPAPHGQT